jgi:cytidyltransferase-like protein
MSLKPVVVSGAFDDLRSRQIRFLEAASRLGEVTVLAWDDDAVQRLLGQAPKFPLAERLYFLRAIRFVSRAVRCEGFAIADRLPDVAGVAPSIWADLEGPANDTRAAFCRGRNLEYRIIRPDELTGFPEPPPSPSVPGRKKVVVTGCYDWVHSGHVRFCEEVSAYGDLYVILGHDANIRLLKGEGHPLLSENERRYVVGSIKYVKQALISSGEGWLDADPEIRRLKPDIYAVNEDGDKGGKREYCAQHGIEYLVLKRTPAPGLPRRSSTDLRGF